MEDQYPYATVYDQECALYGSLQNSLTNEQWYEHFNTLINGGSMFGVTRQLQIPLEHVSAEIGTTNFEDLSDSDQDDIRVNAKEYNMSSWD